MEKRSELRKRKKIVIKVGSSTITHEKTGQINIEKIEKMARRIADLKGIGKDVILVSSGAIAAGRQALGNGEKPKTLSQKQAFSAVGQARLMMIYQKIFSEYNITTAQVLMTKSTMIEDDARYNAQNTFDELLALGAVPIVNENDTISTYEVQFGDNDRLSAIVAALVNADLLILLSDIDGLYSDDPRKNQNAKFITVVPEMNEEFMKMGKGTNSNVGTGGMQTKLIAAKIATAAGADMVIANGKNMDMISEVMKGRAVGTLFMAHKSKVFDLVKVIEEEI